MNTQITKYTIRTGSTYTRIELTVWTYDANGAVVGLQSGRTVYVHRAEYRSWDA